MRTTVLKIYILFLMCHLFQGKIMAQERKSNLDIGLTFAHFSGTSPLLGIFPNKVYLYPFDPGVEILYQYKITRQLAFGTGAGYQRARIPAYLNRFRFGEISFPVLMQFVINPESKTRIFLSTAIYQGKIMHLVVENNGKGELWHKISLKYIEGYSKQSSFTDLAFNAGISFPAAHQNEISVSPMIKFRLNDNWMENYRRSTFYGIKISYQLHL